jgi:hypothetical protein
MALVGLKITLLPANATELVVTSRALPSAASEWSNNVEILPVPACTAVSKVKVIAWRKPLSFVPEVSSDGAAFVPKKSQFLIDTEFKAALFWITSLKVTNTCCSAGEDGLEGVADLRVGPATSALTVKVKVV